MPGTPKHILLVDDNVPGAQTMSTLLKMEGYEVEIAETGRQALDKTESFNPSVIVLDIGLPDINGCEVAQMLRQKKGASTPLIIALSGWGGGPLADWGTKGPFDFYLTKPVNYDDLDRLLTGKNGTASVGEGKP